MKKNNADDPPGGASVTNKVKANIKATEDGISIRIHTKKALTKKKSYKTKFPKEIWKNYPESEKNRLLRNIIFNFTAHLPLSINEEVSFKLNTAQPEIYSWIYNSLMRFLPTYKYLYNNEKSKDIIPILRKILNTNFSFEEEIEEEHSFSKTKEKNVVIPLTFGKDSLLSYYLAKELNLVPTLVYFNEPTEIHAKKHKMDLIDEFTKEKKEKYYFIDNDIAWLREHGNGWFGWESTLTSYALMSLPFAYKNKCRYIIFSNEISCNDYFFGEENIKVMFDYEQSHQATTELSTITKNLSSNNVLCTNFLEGLYEIAILGILKNRYPDSLKYLMSCWAETENAKNNRWCEHCSKCARIYIFLTANGIDPKDVGFQNSMLTMKKRDLFSLFDLKKKAKNTTYDSLGTNRDEQLLAFYLTAIRKINSPLINEFKNSKQFQEAKKRKKELIEKYYGLHRENLSPKNFRKTLNAIFRKSLNKSLIEINNLK